MAIRRTTGISSVVSSIDRRVKAVESGQTTLSAQYANAITVSVSDDDDPNNLDPETNSGTDKKYEYKRVLKAYIYGDKVTGFGSRCELYFGEDPQIEATDPVDVQGINGTSTDDFNISPKQFKVFSVDSSPWDGRQSWRNTPTTGNNGDTITNTVWFNPVVEVPSSYPRTSGRELITTRRIDTVDIDGTTVTVNLNSTHKFELGDIISVDLPAPAFGIDGLFRISDVPDTSTIVYELDSPVGSPVTLDSGDFTGGEAYVYPVARRYIKDGTVWVDKSVSPERVWVWNVLRWYDTAESPLSQVPGADSISPSPVSNLTVTSDSQVVATPGAPGKASITLEWDAPTTNENGTAITDLGGYSVRWRYSVSETWRITEIDDPAITSWYQEDFIYNVPVYLAVYAKDTSGNRSTATTTSITTAASPAPELKAPAAPTVTGYLGTMKVFWDGLDADGNAAHISAFEVELHISTTSGFTADGTTLYERFPAINGPTYTVIPGNAVIAGSPIVDGQTYYFRFKFIDVWGNRTGQSAEESFVGQKSNIVTFDMIDVGTVDGEVLIGAEIRTSVNPSASDGSGGGVVLDDSGFTAYNAAGVQSFNINFATGAVAIPGSGTVTIANYATSDRANAIEQVAISANSIAVTANTNAGTALSTAISANGIAVSASNTASNTNATVSAFTTIEAGVVKISKSNVVSTLNGFNGNTTTIDGGTITTGTVNAIQLSATAIDGKTITGSIIRTNAPVSGNAARVELNSEGIFCFDASGNAPFRAYANGVVFMSEGYTGTLSANNITTGTLTGRSVQTAAAGGKRVLMSQASNSVIFYDSNGTEVGRMEGVTTGSGSLDLSGRGTASINIGLASTVVSGNLSTSGSANITAAGEVRALDRVGQNNWALPAGVGTTFPVTRTATSANPPGVLTTGGTSDIRLKENIVELSDAIATINSLRPVEFTWKTEVNGKKNLGLIAQEVREAIPSDIHLVFNSTDDEDPILGIDYLSFVPVLIKAVQELSAKNDALEARLAALEGNG